MKLNYDELVAFRYAWNRRIFPGNKNDKLKEN